MLRSKGETLSHLKLSGGGDIGAWNWLSESLYKPKNRRWEMEKKTVTKSEKRRGRPPGGGKVEKTIDTINVLIASLPIYERAKLCLDVLRSLPTKENLILDNGVQIGKQVRFREPPDPAEFTDYKTGEVFTPRHLIVKDIIFPDESSTGCFEVLLTSEYGKTGYWPADSVELIS